MGRNSASVLLSRSAEAGVKPKIEALVAETCFVATDCGCDSNCGIGARNAPSSIINNANTGNLLCSELCLIGSPNQQGLRPTIRFFDSARLQAWLTRIVSLGLGSSVPPDANLLN